jgi:hypothetical protein
MSDLVEYSFARDLFERVIRQVLQVIGPVLAVVASTGEGFEIVPVALAVALAVLVTVAKALVDMKAPEGAPVWRVLLDRAGSAAAGTLIGLLPVDAFGLLAVDWQKVAVAVAASAALAVVSYYGAPPSKGRSIYDLAA